MLLCLKINSEQMNYSLQILGLFWLTIKGRLIAGGLNGYIQLQNLLSLGIQFSALDAMCFCLSYVKNASLSSLPHSGESSVFIFLPSH